MDLDLRTLEISEIYAHQVPVKAQYDAQVLTDAPSTPDDNTKTNVENSLRMSLKTQNLKLYFLNTDENVVANLVLDYIHGRAGTLLDVSRELAKFLCQNQPGSSATGMVLVADALCNGSKSLALLKVDNEERVSHSLQNLPDGKKRYNISEIATLGLDAKRLFKAALFVSYVSEDNEELVEIVASDHQVSGSDGRAMANFFLKDFLKCEYVESTASKMVRIAQTILQAADGMPDKAEAAGLATALLTELENNNLDFDIDNFIRSEVPEDSKQDVRTMLEKVGITETIIEKDTTGLDDLNYIAYTLSSGIRIIGPKSLLPNILDATNDQESIIVPGQVVKSKLRKTLG